VAFRIARAAVEVFLDRSELPADMERLRRDLDASSDAAGRSAGKRVGDGIGRGVGDAPVAAPAQRKGTEAGGKFGDAFSAKVKAALRSLPPAEIDLHDEAAQAKLDFIRQELSALSDQRVGVDISDTDAIARLTALRAELDNLAARSPHVQIKADTAAAAAEIDKFLLGTEAKAEVAGKDSGDKLSSGMAKAVSHNSPLIMAAVGGALAFGAPAVLAGAGALFIGIAAVAAHSSDDLSQTWTNTLNKLQEEFKSVTSVTVPMFQQALHRLGDAIAGMRGQFYDVFSSLGGPIDSLTTGLINLIQNMMPGLVAAVRSAGPVFQGLASLMGSIGTGLGQFFQIIAQHSTAAGQVFSSLGQIIGSLLPILGQLVGAGAELASRILPPLAAVLHVVAGALNAVAPILPVVLAGFLGFKAISMLSGPLDNLAQKLSGMGSIGQTASGALSKFGSALPAVGVGLGLLGAAYESSSQQIDTWAHALLDGGNAAAQAQAQMAQATSFAHTFGSGIMGLVGNLTGYAGALQTAAGASKQTADAAKAMYDAMSPLQQKQQDVTKATNELELAIEKYGPDSGQAAGASVELKQKQDDLALAQGRLEQATHGVTQAMIDQADQARAGISSLFGMQHAQEQQRQAEADLAQAIRDHGAASVQVIDAQNHYAEAIYRSAQANAQYQADMSGLKQGSLEYDQFLNSKLLVTLQDMSGTLTGPTKVAVDRFITQLQNAGVTADTTGGKLDNLGTKSPTPTVNLNAGPFSSILGMVNGAIGNLGAQQPTPTAGLNAAPFQFAAGQTAGTMSYLAHLSANPIAYLTALTRDAEYALNYTARTRYATIYATVAGGAGFMGMAASGGQVGAVVGPGFAGGGIFSGRVFGPGGPRDDMVQAITTAGMPLRVSNREWVINADVSEQQGGRRMAALNAGQADIVPRGRRFADGGTQDAPAGGITVQHLDVHVSGVLDFADPGAARQVAVGVRDALIRLDREQH
jgi:hypothetical protein